MRFLDRLLEDAPDEDRLLFQRDLALRDSSDVEQIVNQSRQLIGLTASDAERSLAAVLVQLRGDDRVQHSRQGVPQFMAEHRKEFVLALIGLGQLGQPDFQLLFQRDAFRHVANEASRVQQLVVLPQPARVDENVLDRSVLTSQRRLEVVDDFAAHQPGPELGVAVSIDVKFGELMADVFIGSVSEQSELRRVSPQDQSVRTNLMETFDRVLKEIRKLLLTKVERLLRVLASGLFGFERVRFMLQQTNRAKPLGRRGQRRVTLGGQNRSMLCADFEEQ